MNQFAYFDPNDGRVLQWIDTAAHNYNLPDAALLHPCSDADWLRQQEGEMMVRDGAIMPYVAPVPDPAQVAALAARTVIAERDRLVTNVSLRIQPLQDAADTDSADAAELARLKALKLYRRDLGRIDNPQYEPGFPHAIEWPLDPDRQ